MAISNEKQYRDQRRRQHPEEYEDEEHEEESVLEIEAEGADE